MPIDATGPASSARSMPVVTAARIPGQSQRSVPPTSRVATWWCRYTTSMLTCWVSRTTRATRTDVAPRSTATTGTATLEPRGDRSAPALGHRGGAVAQGAEGPYRIERSAVASPGLGHQRPHVEAVCPVEVLRGHRRVTRLLARVERVAIDEQRLRDRELDLVGRLGEVLERVLQVVGRVDHVADLRHPAVADVDELEAHQEELVRVDRTDREVVVAVLRVVEVEAAQAPRHRQATDHLLHVGAREVVPQVDQAFRAGTRAFGQEERGAP